MLQRNLLYTSVTRAKKKLIIVGERNAVFIAVMSNDTVKRNTRLAERLIIHGYAETAHLTAIKSRMLHTMNPSITTSQPITFKRNGFEVYYLRRCLLQSLPAPSPFSVIINLKGVMKTAKNKDWETASFAALMFSIRDYKDRLTETHGVKLNSRSREIDVRIIDQSAQKTRIN